MIEAWLQQGSVGLEELGGGISRVRMSTRLTRSFGLEASAFLVDDILVDTGFAHVRELVVRRLADRTIRAICCTHNHEDHTASCAALSRAQGCPVFLRRAEAKWDEGVARMRPYRRRFWGPVEPYEAEEMPPEVRTERRGLRAIPTPGHSQTHTVFLDERTGAAFTGDLYVSAGASAVMTHENPYESIASLRRVAGLEPSRMLTGHGLDVEAPAELLRRKADRLEEAAALVVELHGRGAGLREILRRVFPRGAAKSHFMDWMTGGEFTRRNFLRACLIHRPGP